jgi:hypothetical protein
LARHKIFIIMEMFLVGIGKMKGIPRLRLLGIFFFFFGMN